MTFQPTYPRPCIDCGTPINSAEERYGTYWRCRPCGLAEGRAKQQRVKARRRGEDVPKRKPGPTATTYPFPCKDCGVAVTSKAERGENWHLCKACLRERKRLMKLEKRYGLSPEQYAELEVRHAGKCGICGSPPSAFGLVVDHSHSTGAVRGLLCLACNWLLGHAQDDPARLRAAERYLYQHMSDDELEAEMRRNGVSEQEIRSMRSRLNFRIDPVRDGDADRS